jgi:hypothetical protein
LGKSADLAVWKPLRRTISVLALCIVVQYENRESQALSGFGVLQYLPVGLAVSGATLQCFAN